MMLEFDKYEGLGNDFIVVDAKDDAAVTPEQARKLCDRHFGIGADGVLLVTPPRSAEGRASMVVINADGSRPEMCGNGLRCVALHLALQDDAVGISYVVDTDAGPLSCEVERDGDAAMVRTSMGRGRPQGEHSAEHASTRLDLALVSMGNPHAIVFDSHLDSAAVDACAPEISAAFPEGCNIEFAETRGPRAFDLVVWERGVGRTLACGTGAAATVVAAARAGRVPYGEPVEVHLPGGPLSVTVAPETLEVVLRGPARRVFRGRVDKE
ncbi:MAG: diaminopimelate epimerase [Polyangiaceae bacterium]|nr:diaminopimelate epimerase [Polyangiaceae bacterium]